MNNTKGRFALASNQGWRLVEEVSTMGNEELYMRQAIALANEAIANEDHPFGALLVKDGVMVLTAVH